jgi:hypothetical protein
MIVGVISRLCWILFLCSISFIHSNVEAKAGNLCCNPSFLRSSLGAYNAGHDLADIILIKSTLRLLSGGGDGESSSNGNDNEINETKKKEETFFFYELQEHYSPEEESTQKETFSFCTKKS